MVANLDLDLQRLFPHQQFSASSKEPSSLQLALAIPFVWETQPGLSNLESSELPAPIYPLPPPPRLLPHYGNPSPRSLILQRYLSCKVRDFFSTLRTHTETPAADKLASPPAFDDADLCGWKLLGWIADDELVDYNSGRSSCSSRSSCEHSGEFSRSLSFSSTPKTRDSSESVLPNSDFGHKTSSSLKDWIKNPKRRLEALSPTSPFRACPWHKYSAVRSSLLCHAKITSSKMKDIFDRKFSHSCLHADKLDAYMDAFETKKSASPPLGLPRSFSKRLRGLFEDNLCGVPIHVRA